MISLDFQVDEDALAEDLESRPTEANTAAVEQTYFVMPVRFAVGETELLAYPGVYESWRPQPLVGFSTHLVGSILAVSPGETKRCYIADGGHLDLARSEWTMRITASLLKRTESVPTNELLTEARAFRERVREFLLERVPGMGRHESWQVWFPG